MGLKESWGLWAFYGITNFFCFQNWGILLSSGRGRSTRKKRRLPSSSKWFFFVTFFFHQYTVSLLFFTDIISRLHSRTCVLSYSSVVLILSLSLRLSKSEEDNNELKATISSLSNEECKIRGLIRVSGQQNEHALAFTIRNSGSTTI